MRVIPDDEVYRVNTVWLGPSGLTLPWTARYMAYAVWLSLFVLILLIERITPLSVGVPPVWEICLTTLLTYAAMEREELLRHTPKIVHVDSRNRIVVPASAAADGRRR